MVYAAEFVRKVDMQIYFISSTIRKTTINLNTVYTRKKSTVTHTFIHHLYALCHG